MKVLRVILIIAASLTTIIAQPSDERNRELSLSGSYQNFSSGGSSRSTGALLISPKLGLFVHEGWELEPEILFMLSSGADPVYMLNGNVSYNFISGGESVPFLLIGYGLANTVPYMNVPFTKTDFAVGVFNAGAGVKVFLKENIALRVEYRFQKFYGQGDTAQSGYYSYTQKVDARIHAVHFGFSILL